MPLPEQRKNAVPRNLTSLHSALDAVSGVMVRHELMYRGLEVPAVASVPELHRLAIAYVETGALSASDVRVMVLDGREYSNKRAFLFRADANVLSRWTPEDPDAVLTDRATARLVTSAGPERLCYTTISNNRVRAVFTERHINKVVDYEARTVTDSPVQKVIAFAADLSEGHMALLLDAPGRKHPHGSRQGDYFNYWKERIAAFFRVTPDAFPLDAAVGALELQNRIKLPFTVGRTATGTITITGIEVDDIRALPEFAELQERRIARQQDEYVWVPRPAAGEQISGIPIRDVKTDIDMKAGEIRFMQHALACEVEYVLEQLRTNA